MAELSEIEQRILLQRSRFPNKSSKEIASAIGISTSFVENFLKTRAQELSQSLPVQIKTDQIVSGRFSDGNVVLKFESGKTIFLGRVSDLSGPPGPQGVQGPAGATGAAGANGADGVGGSDGAISGRWIYDSTYNSNPGQTYFQSDDPNWNDIGKFYLNDTEYETASSFIAYFQIMQMYLGIPVDVYLEIQCVHTNALKENKALYMVYGVTNVGGVWEILVGVQQRNGSPQPNRVHAFKFLAMGVSTLS